MGQQAGSAAGNSEQFMADDTPQSAPTDWAAVRVDYEAGLMTRNGVAHKHRLNLWVLERHARAKKWVRDQSDIADRRIVIFKLMGLLERQIDHLDEQMQTGDKRELAVLHSMVRDLEKLIAIEKAEPEHQHKDTRNKAMSVIHKQLEQRINAITESR